MWKTLWKTLRNVFMIALLDWLKGILIKVGIKKEGGK